MNCSISAKARFILAALVSSAAMLQVANLIVTLVR